MGHLTGLRAVQDNTPLHDARILTGADGVARIMLDGQMYTLRITRSGKLILTK
ncbi:MAG: hemin uptake protein HemP [Shimia sp.]